MEKILVSKAELEWKECGAVAEEEGGSLATSLQFKKRLFHLPPPSRAGKAGKKKLQATNDYDPKIKFLDDKGNIVSANNDGDLCVERWRVVKHSSIVCRRHCHCRHHHCRCKSKKCAK